MKGFIEIIAKDGKRKLLNVQRIEEISEVGEHHCKIFIATDATVMGEQFHYEVRKSYDEIVALIEKAVNV